jgi:hypothetical protein
MAYIYVIITELKTSGLTDTHTSVCEAFEIKDDADAALEVYMAKYERDYYSGKPKIVKLKLNKEKCK